MASKETQNIDLSNVVSFDNAKKQNEHKKQEESISKYLGILSFSQLIHETSDTIRNLDNEAINKQMAMKSQLVIKELGSRIEKQSGHAIPSLNAIKKQIDKKIRDIQSYL